MVAVELGRDNVVETLINKGADVNKQDNIGGTALMLAALYRHINIVKKLLKSGADVNAKTKFDATTLSIAKMKGFSRIIKILKNAGAKQGLQRVVSERWF